MNDGVKQELGFLADMIVDGINSNIDYSSKAFKGIAHGLDRFSVCTSRDERIKNVKELESIIENIALQVDALANLKGLLETAIMIKDGELIVGKPHP